MKNNQEVINYINNLKNYCGYIQFSDEKIRECDIFKEYQDIQLVQTKGFIYEAHFWNGTDSISIKQINNSWIISENKNISQNDIQKYIAKDGLKVKMAQIWDTVEDEFCEGMQVKKLKKVVFAGFDNIQQKNEEITQDMGKLQNEKYTQKEKEILLNHFLTLFNDEYITMILGQGEQK